jgi:hypothetical protein
MTLRGRFSFSSDDHTYRVGRWLVPGITEILRAAGFINDRYYGSASRNRGSVAHAITEGLDVGTVDVDRIDGPLRGWVLAYTAFVRACRPDHALVEAAVVNRRLGFATHVDRAGRLLGHLALWNIKTGPADSWHGVQRAAEVLALDGRRTNRKRYTLYIRNTGTFSLEEHRNDADFDAFEDALYQWRLGCHNPARHGPLSLLSPLAAASLRAKPSLPRPRSSSKRRPLTA